MDALAPTLIVLCLAAAIYAFYHSRQIIEENPFLDKHLLKRGTEKPPLWLYYDTSDVNSRHWYDFGARSYRALNLPFLNLCYETIVAQNKEHYRIEVITGLSGLAALLGGPSALPSGLQNPLTTVNEAHLNWIRAAVLAKFGGLWVSPHTVCLKPFAPLTPEDNVTFYGTDLDETYAGKEGTPLPGFRCIASPRPAHPLFVEWEQLTRARLDQLRGGQEIRGDAKWDWVALTSKYPGIQVDFAAECARKQGGRRMELEDLLATGTEGNLPFPVPSYSIYVPIFWTELRDREIFGWFLRLSEEQILESDIAIRYLIDRGLGRPMAV